MKSGLEVASHSFDAADDAGAVAYCRMKCMDNLDPDTETVYIWQSLRFVWGHGIEAKEFYNATPTFQNIGDE